MHIASRLDKIKLDRKHDLRITPLLNCKLTQNGLDFNIFDVTLKRLVLSVKKWRVKANQTFLLVVVKMLLTSYQFSSLFKFACYDHFPIELSLD